MKEAKTQEHTQVGTTETEMLPVKTFLKEEQNWEQQLHVYNVSFKADGDILEVNDSHGCIELTVYWHTELSSLKHLSLYHVIFPSS